MAAVLAIGGTGFIGRATTTHLSEAGHDVTVVSRGAPPNSFTHTDIQHKRLDRNDTAALRSLAEEIGPDWVIDFAAFKPAQVQAAVDLFATVDAYVYISSTHAYEYAHTIPLRERDTPIKSCTPEQAEDESFATYGHRKAAGDRIVMDAAANGMNAKIIRPAAIFGPHDGTTRVNYWINRVNTYDEIVVPGDTSRMPTHLGYLSDVVSAIQLVLSAGDPGAAYNVAHRRQLTFDQFLRYIADALDTTVTVVHANEPELAAVDLTPEQFSYGQSSPYIVSTTKIHELGLTSTPFDDAIATTVSAHLENDTEAPRYEIGRDRELDLIASATGARTDIDGINDP